MTALTAISPKRAAELAKNGAVFVDIREADEYAREHISGARHMPLSGIALRGAATPGEVVIFHCRSGMRSQANENRLAAAAPSCDAYVMEGGLEAWKRAGFPVATDRKQPIEIMRQVQIAAGSLICAGVALGFGLHPAFFALSGFVGAGLIGAGVTGTCLMAKILAAMPWNRRGRNAAAMI